MSSNDQERAAKRQKLDDNNNSGDEMEGVELEQEHRISENR
jgi:hypothetical protein